MLKKEKLDETALIKYIEKLSLETQKFNKSLIVESIGDDCAVIEDKKKILVSSDSITENVHFNLGPYDFDEVGKKSLLVNLSDIAAMGGIPRLFLLSLFIPPYIETADIKQLLRGIIAEAKKYRVSLIGGNISSASELSVSITIIGDCKGEGIRRFNSKSGNAVYVSGELGNSWMAFYLNSNKNSIFKNRRNLKPEDKKLIADFIDKYKLPEPRINLGKKLFDKMLANSLTDVSDGIFKDIFNVIGKGCGCEIKIEDVPVNRDLKKIVRILGIKDYMDKVVSFGEDYELLWTFDREYTKKELSELSDSCGAGIKKIGYIDDKPANLAFLKNGVPFVPQNFTFRHIQL